MQDDPDHLVGVVLHVEDPAIGIAGGVDQAVGHFRSSAPPGWAWGVPLAGASET